MTVKILLLVALVAAAKSIATSNDVEAEFQKYVSTFERRYASAAEWKERRANFERNMQRAAEFAKTNPQASFGPTRFTDRSDEEIARMLGYRRAANRARRSPRAIPEELVNAAPDAIDWRLRGVVGAVKDQGQCGSCWAFSTIANIESQWALAGNKLTSLSEQQLVSCDTYDGGCDGGDTFAAYQWLIYNGNGEIASEASFPYTSGSGTAPPCKKNLTGAARIEGYTPLPQNETLLAAATAAYGPPSICLNANVLMSYIGGIITTCPNHKTDHCVLIVGYNTTNKPPYWIVRNSWGASWGEKGYFRLEMYKDLCGMLDEPSMAQVKKTPGQGNVTYVECSDASCTSCQPPVEMENGVCSDGGQGWSLKVTCSESKVSMLQYSDPLCTGKVVVNVTTVPDKCSPMSGGYYRVTCS